MVQLETDKQVVSPHHPLSSCPLLFYSLEFVCVYASCSTKVKWTGGRGLPKPEDKPHGKSGTYSQRSGNCLSICCWGFWDLIQADPLAQWQLS